MSTPDPEQKARRVKEALFRGNKIEAIKLYRAEAGVGLAEAKNAIEKLEAELRTSSPESFRHAPAPAGKGCSTVLFACAGAGALIWRLVAT
jgi:endonuclease V-like protein UPF0215 family